MWQNGLYLPIKLPPSAPIEDVLAQIYEKEHFYQSGKVGAYQVIEIRKVFNNHYTAVLIDTNLGKKIVLLNYDYQLNSWWNRVYDATPKVFGL